MDQIEVWNVLAEGWYNWRYWSIKLVEEFSKKWKPGKILDIGCGNCRNLIPFLKEGFVGYGIDFSEVMLENAKKRLGKEKVGAKLKLGSAEKLPFKKSNFDYCIFIASLHHLSEKGRKKALKEMKRVLKKNGKALITVWKGEDKKEGYISWRRKGKTYKRYYYFYDKEELDSLLKEVGFKVVKTSHDKKNLIFIIKK